jgi:hypothetical protein
MPEYIPYNYQVKCRICAKLSNVENHENYSGFLDTINGRLKCGELCKCDKCEHDTVHDIVSYSTNRESKETIKLKLKELEKYNR